MSQDYQTRQLHTKEENLSGPICTNHNSHTHTGNTRQPEPQLKSSLCSSVILSHSSRDVILSHNSRNVTCLTPIPSHNSRNISKPTFKVSQKHCRSRTNITNKAYAFVLSPGGFEATPSETRFQTASRGTRAAKRQAPLIPLPLQVSSGGTTIIARRHAF